MDGAYYQLDLQYTTKHVSAPPISQIAALHHGVSGMIAAMKQHMNRYQMS